MVTLEPVPAEVAAGPGRHLLAGGFAAVAAVVAGNPDPLDSEQEVGAPAVPIGGGSYWGWVVAGVAAAAVAAVVVEQLLARLAVVCLSVPELAAYRGLIDLVEDPQRLGG